MQDFPLERLDGRRFQGLVQTLLTGEYQGVQCFPLSGPDGGRDAVVAVDGARIVFQAKFWEPNPLLVPTSDAVFDWLIGAIKGELVKIKQLQASGLERYVVVTNAASTGHPGGGLRDRVANYLQQNVGVPAECWWREDLERRLAGDFDTVMHYQLVQGPDSLRALLEERFAAQSHGSIHVNAREPRVTTFIAFLAKQADEDKELKFTQAELDATPLLDFFVDVKAEAARPRSNVTEGIERTNRIAEPYLAQPDFESVTDSGRSTIGAAALLLTWEDIPALESVVLEGAPGQGKSTLGQFVCQVHRVRLLDLQDDVRGLSELYRVSPLRLPIRVDLRDFAIWLDGDDPFRPGKTVGANADSLEEFVAFLIASRAGGHSFSVDDLYAVLGATDCFIVLDGLDEVPNQKRRDRVIELISEARVRLHAAAKSLRMIITTRPAIFVNSKSFDETSFAHLRLVDLDLRLIFEYAETWLTQRKVGEPVAQDILNVLRSKLGSDHISNLTRNPMQLAILLYLIQRRSVSLPEKRTALYSSYLETFLDREAEKGDIVRDYRDLVVELHGYIAWVLHARAEEGDSGRILESEAKELLKNYLIYERRDPRIVDALFEGMVQRVVMLVSRVQGAYEFEVQPLREYFAARYLYEQAPSSALQHGIKGTRADRFDAICRRPYWLNATRFFAGFYDKGELADLARRVVDLIQEPDQLANCYSRSVGLYLLGDHVFDSSQRDVPHLVEAAVDDLGLRASLDSYARVHLWPMDIAQYAGIRHGFSLPRQGGWAELMSIIATKIKASPPPIILGRWVDLLVSEMSTEERESVWQQLQGSLSAEDWLLLGSTLEVLATQPIADVTGHLHPVDKSFSLRLAVRSRLRDWLALTDWADLLVELNSPGVSNWPYGTTHRPSSRHRWWVTSLLGILNVRTLSYYRQGFMQPLHGMDERPEVDFGGTPLSAPVSDIRSLCQELDEMRVATVDWGRDYESYLRLFGRVGAALGLGWPLISVALIAATVSGAHVKGLTLDAESDLSDESLMHHVRHLRVNASKPETWEPWFSHPLLHGGPHLRRLVLVSACAWAPSSVIEQHLALMEQWAQEFSAQDLEMVKYSVEGLDEIRQPGRARPGPLSQELVQTLSGSASALSFLLLRRCRVREGDQVLRGLLDDRLAGTDALELRGPIGTDLLTYVLSMSPKSVGEEWWLDTVELIFGSAWAGDPVFHKTAWADLKSLSKTGSHRVLSTPTKFPDRLVEAAEDYAYQSASQGQGSVAAVAAQDKWFPDAIWSRG